MKLVMYIGNDCIAAISVERARISIPGYISGLKKTLLNQHLDQLYLVDDAPEFLFLKSDESSERL
jgi:hypothetical protein